MSERKRTFVAHKSHISNKDIILSVPDFTHSCWFLKSLPRKDSIKPINYCKRKYKILPYAQYNSRNNCNNNSHPSFFSFSHMKIYPILFK